MSAKEVSSGYGRSSLSLEGQLRTEDRLMANIIYSRIIAIRPHEVCSLWRGIGIRRVMVEQGSTLPVVPLPGLPRTAKYSVGQPNS